MANDPFRLFEEWFASARMSEPNDPEAMALATSSSDGHPHVRMVLLKGHSPEGFTFYTNEESAKGRQIAENAKAALLFHWKSLRRQVRIEGSAKRIPTETADAYFASRARESQLGAWASDQSRPLDSRSTFEHRFEAMRLKFEGRDVPRPSYWGGYLIVPDLIEFWQDRPHRLHERRLFVRKEDGWQEGLLYP